MYNTECFLKNDTRTRVSTNVLALYIQLYALRLLKIIEPYLVEQDRMANAQLLGYWVEAFGAELLFLVNKKKIDPSPRSQNGSF